MEPITAEQLHEAAERVTTQEDFQEAGFAEGAIEKFVEESTFFDGPDGNELPLDPLSLGYGVGVGIDAALHLVKDAHSRGAPDREIVTVKMLRQNAEALVNSHPRSWMSDEKAEEANRRRDAARAEINEALGSA